MLLRRSRLFACGLLLWGVAHGVAASPQAPLDAAVYERAEGLLGRNLLSHVQNTFFTPHWLGEGEQFWYRRELPNNGHEDVVIDSSTGRRTTAYDAQELARQVAEAYPAPASSTEVLMAPDGSRGVTSHNGNLWLVDSKTSPDHPLTTDGNAVSGYAIWADDWAGIAIARERLLMPTPPVETYWAPDSRIVLVPYIDQQNVLPYPYVESAPKDGSFRPQLHLLRIPLLGEHTDRFELYLIDTDTGTRRHIDLPYDRLLAPHQDLTAFCRITWSADARHLFLVAHGENMSSAYVFDVDTRTGQARTVLEEHLSPRTDLNSSTYNPTNARIVRDGRELLWFSQRDGWGHLYRYDLRSGKLLNRITQGNWLVREIIDVDEKRGVIYFTGGGREGGDPYFRYLYRVNFDGSGFKLLSPEPADHLLLPNEHWLFTLEGIRPYAPISPNGRYVAYNYSRLDLPTRLVVRRTADAALIGEIDHSDDSGLRAAGWRPPESFTVKAADGKSDLWGTIYLPSDFDPHKHYPIIDAEYASPLIAVVPHNFYTGFRGLQPLTPASYAELGFVVVSVDARGTTFRSAAFTQARFGELNVIGLDDHIAAIKALAQTRPYMDADHVGIVGHSYGGYAALRALLEFPDFYKVAIASAAMCDSQGMYPDYQWTAFQGNPVYSDGTAWRPKPDEVPSNWSRLNASSLVQNLRGKLLIQVGELDENALPAQVLQFTDALIKANKDFEMLYLPARDHQFIGEGYVIRRDWDFMVRNLQGREPPPGYQIKVNGR